MSRPVRAPLCALNRFGLGCRLNEAEANVTVDPAVAAVASKGEAE